MCESLKGSVEGAPRHADMRGKLLVRAVHVCAMDLQGLSLLGQRMFPSSEPLTRGGSVMWPCNDAVSTSRCGRQSRLHPPTLQIAEVRFSVIWGAVSHLRKRVKEAFEP